MMAPISSEYSHSFQFALVEYYFSAVISLIIFLYLLTNIGWHWFYLPSAFTVAYPLSLFRSWHLNFPRLTY